MMETGAYAEEDMLTIKMSGIQFASSHGVEEGEREEKKEEDKGEIDVKVNEERVGEPESKVIELQNKISPDEFLPGPPMLNRQKNGIEGTFAITFRTVFLSVIVLLLMRWLVLIFFVTIIFIMPQERFAGAFFLSLPTKYFKNVLWYFLSCKNLSKIFYPFLLGLAFIGLSLSRYTDGDFTNKKSISRQSQFDFDLLQDREYKYFSSTNDDGWLVGREIKKIFLP